MFAKLKKKLIEEPGSNGGDSGDRSLSGTPNSLSSPSHANAFQRSSGTSTPVHSPLTKEPHAGGLGTRNFADNAVTPLVTLLDDSKVREANLSLEEVMMQLAKRTEQCKKMEGNISDLAALIKDKNRNIERLETQIKQHETVLSQKLAEQKADFEVYRDKLIAGYQEDKLALEKEKQELTRQLQEAKEYRDKYLQHEAETDEMQDFTAQELSKVKHMLLLAQGELESCQQDLLAKSQKLNTCEHKMKQLETQVVHLSQKTERMETECQRLLEDNRERAELVTSLTKEKSSFDRRLDELNKELTEKQNHIIELNMQLSDLDSKHRVLEHNTECHKSKTAKLLEEKQDHIETLLDRVATLELRLQDHNLSGDERVTALQAERDGLEKKLAETRQQLTEIKSTWSDKISHLEEQISHLNSKIVEDSEELASSERAAETMRENFHRQMEDLRSNLADAERRALENLEIANSKDAHHERIIHNMEMELTQTHFVAKDNDTQLRGKIASLEAQLSELETACQAEQQAAEYKCRQLEEQHTQAVVKEFHNEQRLKAAEAQTAHLQNKLDAQHNELVRLHSVLESKEQTTKSYDQKLTEFENQSKELQAQLALSASQLSAMKKQLLENEQEKGELMVRNAQLSQQLNTHTHQENQQRQEVEGLLAEKDSTILDQLNTIQYLNNRLAQLEQQTNQVSLVNTEDLRLTIHHLQDQLADKTRTLKKQEQTVKDLRQTLQRELKVQVLPNDELSDDNTSSPSMSRKFPMRNAASSNGSQFSLSISSSLTSTSQSSITTPSLFATAAVKPMTNSAIVPVSDQRGLVVRRDLEQDVNFQYLKHVVLKFMLSRESEAVQLIRAVAVLLNFTQQEQQLIKQTLEWKMSWFGSRPSLGKGQTAKMIPPSF